MEKAEPSNVDTNDLPKEVEAEEYYHGLLPREDLPCLLEQVI